MFPYSPVKPNDPQLAEGFDTELIVYNEVFLAGVWPPPNFAYACGMPRIETITMAKARSLNILSLPIISPRIPLRRRASDENSS